MGCNVKLGRFLLLWQIDQNRIPVNKTERYDGWIKLISTVKNHMKTGITKDWGAFIGESKGFCIVEGLNKDISIALQEYAPFVTFKTYPITELNDVEKVIASLKK